MFEFFQEAVHLGAVPHETNRTFIYLIPKVSSPEELTQLRPISLCNVLVKVISKVLANHLQSVLPRLVSGFQSSFVSGRLTTDNITTAQEIIHTLRKRKSRKVWMIVKLDLEKAYDRVSWDFLRKVLRAIGFKPHLMELIMNIITTASMQICWNGEILDGFSPQRGLRQGDPLSPYLFVLFMETLSSRINRDVVDKQWQPIQIVKKDNLSRTYFLRMIFCSLERLPTHKQGL